MANFTTKLEIELDPLAHYVGKPPMGLVDACGFIPQWIIGAYKEEDDAVGYFERILNAFYPFMPDHNMASTITEEGLHQYPDDPDLYPYIKIKGRYETLYQYPFAIVAILNNETKEAVFIKRMD